MAASDWFYITVHGKQAHGSAPWSGIDPIVVSAEIIQGLQTIVSRQVDLTDFPAVITVGKINSGVRANIIPEQAEMVGTIRTLDTAMQRLIHEKIKLTVTKIAESAGATAEVRIENKTPVTYNNPALTAWALPSLQEAAGAANVSENKARTARKTLAFLAKKSPVSISFLVGCPRRRREKSALAPYARFLCGREWDEIGGEEFLLPRVGLFAKK